jgi:hypothetical protein
MNFTRNSFDFEFVLNYKYLKGYVKLKMPTIIKHVTNKINDSCIIF